MQYYVLFVGCASTITGNIKGQASLSASFRPLGGCRESGRAVGWLYPARTRFVQGCRHSLPSVPDVPLLCLPIGQLLQRNCESIASGSSTDGFEERCVLRCDFSRGVGGSRRRIHRQGLLRKYLQCVPVFPAHARRKREKYTDSLPDDCLYGFHNWYKR